MREEAREMSAKGAAKQQEQGGERGDVQGVKCLACLGLARSSVSGLSEQGREKCGWLGVVK